MTIVVFETRAPTAFWSCATVETLTTFPEGGGSGGAGGGTVKALTAWLPAKASASARGDAGRKEPRRRPSGLFSPHGAGSFCMKRQVYTLTPGQRNRRSCRAVFSGRNPHGRARSTPIRSCRGGRIGRPRRRRCGG